eukprot:TRINITY_DN9854_c0_g1_i2.p1 TRINITY_DN9854_c0_g1~~TRINITY_DN9854_c0_g1_i2.p1  ORF type:complete len:439 (+),score=87.14 TRINITY_DN9854_c0_g1_i2:42-1358(+)
MSDATKRPRVGDDTSDAIIGRCVVNRCCGSITAEVKATAVHLFETYVEVDTFLRRHLQRGDLKQAYKILEQLWMEVMQTEEAAALNNPVAELLGSHTALQRAEKSWGKRLPKHAALWPDLVGVFKAACGERQEALVRIFSSESTSEEFKVREGLTGKEVMEEPHVVWQEVQDTYNPEKKREYLEGFTGRVLQWSVRYSLDGEKEATRMLLTRPLVSPTLDSLADSQALQLAVHTLVYGSMFVTGQAMGLSPRFHAALAQEAWAAGDVCLEMYSHLVNRRSSPHPFLTMVPKADGSSGRMQDFCLEGFVKALGSHSRGVLFCNPPYVEAVMNRDLPKVVAAVDQAAEQGKRVAVISLLPDWVDNEGVAAVLGSGHLRSHWHLKKNRHKACLENGTEVTMGVGQRLCLLSTATDDALSESLWGCIATGSETAVPPDCKLK